MDYNFESLANDIGRLAGNLSQSEQKKFLKSEAKQFKKAVIRKAQEETTEDTGNYVQGYKVGNPTTRGNEVAVPTINDSNMGIELWTNRAMKAVLYRVNSYSPTQHLSISQFFL